MPSSNNDIIAELERIIVPTTIPEYRGGAELARMTSMTSFTSTQGVFVRSRPSSPDPTFPEWSAFGVDQDDTTEVGSIPDEPETPNIDLNSTATRPSFKKGPGSVRWDNDATWVRRQERDWDTRSAYTICVTSLSDVRDEPLDAISLSGKDNLKKRSKFKLGIKRLGSLLKKKDASIPPRSDMNLTLNKSLAAKEEASPMSSFDGKTPSEEKKHKRSLSSSNSIFRMGRANRSNSTLVQKSISTPKALQPLQARPRPPSSRTATSPASASLPVPKSILRRSRSLSSFNLDSDDVSELSLNDSVMAEAVGLSKKIHGRLERGNLSVRR